MELSAKTSTNRGVIQRRIQNVTKNGDFEQHFIISIEIHGAPMHQPGW